MLICKISTYIPSFFSIGPSNDHSLKWFNRTKQTLVEFDNRTLRTCIAITSQLSYLSLASKKEYLTLWKAFGAHSMWKFFKLYMFFVYFNIVQFKFSNYFECSLIQKLCLILTRPFQFVFFFTKKRVLFHKNSCSFFPRFFWFWYAPVFNKKTFLF